MPASIFSETELARLASFPEEIPGDDPIRAFTLTGADRDLVAIRRGAANRLGLALQLCALRYLGFVPRHLSAAPRSAACFVADQLEVSPDEIQSYARREQTRRQHCTEVREHLGFSMFRSRDLEKTAGWRLEGALPRCLVGFERSACTRRLHPVFLRRSRDTSSRWRPDCLCVGPVHVAFPNRTASSAHGIGSHVLQTIL